IGAPRVNEAVDVAIIGGGLVGLATALRLLESRPALRLTVIEQETELAVHQSGHNSGVIHAGLYYPPGSLKAALCREGKADLEAARSSPAAASRGSTRAATHWPCPPGPERPWLAPSLPVPACGPTGSRR